MKKLIFSLLVMGGFFILAPNVALAVATISGTVTHQDGTAVNGISMYLYDSDGNYESGDGTDSSGNYLMENVAAGTYTLKNSTTNSTEPNIYFILSSQSVTVVDGESKDVDFTLTRRARLTGHVYESDGSTPIYYAYIYALHVDGSAFGSAYYYSLTDGSYYLSPSATSSTTSAAGLYNLYVTKVGYFGQKIEDVDLAQDEVTNYTQDINLTGASTVSGQVVNSSGDPISGVTVTLRESDTAYYRTYTDVTDSNGQYSISVYDLNDYNGTAVGSYTLSTSKSGYVAKSVNFAISSNESTLADNNFTLTKSGAIRGTVYKSNGATPLSGATISADDGYGNTYSTTSASNGSYTLSSLRSSSKYTLTVSKSNYVTKKMYGVSVSKGKTTSSKNFKVSAAKSFSGTIKSKSNTVLEGATVYLYSRNKARSDAADYSATCDSNGNFSFTTIASGKYRLKVTKNGYLAYEKESASITKDISNKVYKLSPESSIYGRVTYDKKGVAGASIYVYSEHEDKDVAYSSTTTDNDGYYRLANLKHGSYDIRVITTQYAQKITSKDIKEGTQTTANIALSLAGYISGYVLDASTGLPLSGYLVKVKDSAVTASTDNNGYYILDGLAAGSYKIYVSSTGYKTQYYGGVEEATTATSITVKASETTTGKNFSLLPR